MLNMIRALGEHGYSIDIPVQGEVEGVVLESVEGLEPVKATIVSSGLSTRDGTYFQSGRREPRNIKIRCSLEAKYAIDVNNPAQTIAELRRSLYPFFMPNRDVTLKFYSTDLEIVEIFGRVESFDTVLFSKDPAVDISIMCFDPDLKAELHGGIIALSTTTTALTVDAYPGSVPTGMVFYLYPATGQNLPNGVSIYYQEPDGTTQSMHYTGPINAGENLMISSEAGAKKVILTSSGVPTSKLHLLTAQSDWITVKPGIGQIRVYTAIAGVQYYFLRKNRYGGL